jgi:DnaK suppressor protein
MLEEDFEIQRICRECRHNNSEQEKTRDKMEKTKIEQFSQNLEVQRQEILRSLRQIEQETRSLEIDTTQDAADLCVSSMSKEALFQQSSQRRTILRRIEGALRRIEEGSFGVCVNCGEDIPARRLQALPWTQSCLRCQEEIEQQEHGNLSQAFPTPAAEVWKRAG